ncbi:hypothetical protein MASR2M78_09120 [Treponema sp.]
MIKAIVKAFVALNSNVKKEQIAAGFAWGLLLALIPTGNLIWFTLFVFAFFTKINYGMQLLVMVLFKLILPLAAKPLDKLGWYILNQDSLYPYFSYLYNIPIAPLTRFNNTLVAGGLVLGLILWIPLFFIVRALVSVYRSKLAPKIAETAIYKAFMKIPLVKGIAKAISSANNVAGALK